MLTEPFRVMGLDDPVDEEVYTSQQLVGTPLGLPPGIEPDPEVGYQYITVRDGVSLGAMIRFPDPRLYGDGPYPTVIEYSATHRAVQADLMRRRLSPTPLATQP